MESLKSNKSYSTLPLHLINTGYYSTNNISSEVQVAGLEHSFWCDSIYIRSTVCYGFLKVVLQTYIDQELMHQALMSL